MATVEITSERALPERPINLGGAIVNDLRFASKIAKEGRMTVGREHKKRGGRGDRPLYNSARWGLLSHSRFRSAGHM